jgi:membrane fusion protein (multidrug efflux system)
MKTTHHPPVLVLLLAVLLAGCSGSRSNDQLGPLPVTVTAYGVEPGSAAYDEEYPATVIALNQVEVRPEVTGYITNVYFSDGQHVRKDAKLYAIDQRQYRAAYDQALANLNVAKANQAKTQQDVDRYTALSKDDAVARQTFEHALADLQASKMQVAAAQAAVQSAETNLRYAVIVAPFDCTIGISQVKLGSAVTAGQTLLNTVSSDDPMAADIAVDEKQIGRFERLLRVSTAKADSTFRLVLPDRTVYPFPGRISFLDRAVDPQTGTLRVRLVFPNPQGALKSGLTCDLRVRSFSPGNSVLIPFRAVAEQMGEYSVFLVSGERVSQRRITLGVRIRDKVVVTQGLHPGDRVVTEGTQRLKDNSPVAVNLAGAGQAADSVQGK